MTTLIHTPTSAPPDYPGDDEAIELSVVVPVYDEEENVEELHRRITEACVALGVPYEILIVDDGSRDGTFQILERLAESDPRLKLLRFGRNFGQTAAMSAGFDFSQGEVIVPLDGDLQNDPADIALLLAKLEEGYDVVSGWRVDRQDAAMPRGCRRRSPTG